VAIGNPVFSPTLLSGLVTAAQVTTAGVHNADQPEWNVTAYNC